MLAADTKLDIRTGHATALAGNVNKRADATNIDRCKWVVLDDLALAVARQEAAGVVAAHAESGLRQVIGTETEELRGLCNLICSNRGTRQLDHGAHLVIKLLTSGCHDFACNAVDGFCLQIKLALECDQRNHHFNLRADAGLLDSSRCLEDGARLHLSDFREHNSKSATTESKHRIELMEFVHATLDVLDRNANLVRKILLLILGVRQELMKRWIEQANACRTTFKRAQDAIKVRALIRQQLRKRTLTAWRVLAKNHLAHRINAVAFKEHVLRTAQTNAFRTKRHGLAHLLRSVGVGTNAKAAIAIRKVHDELEVAGYAALRSLHGASHQHLLQLTVSSVDLSLNDLAGGAVDGEEVPLMQCLSIATQGALVVIDHDLACTSNAHLAHLPGNQRSVA